MALNSNNYKTFTLDNGLVVGLCKTPMHTFSGRLDVFHGRLNEQPGEEGLSHFLEHSLANAGTKSFSPDKQKWIYHWFPRSNAETGLQFIGFPVAGLASDIPLYLEYISSVVSEPLFDERKVELERQRVLREFESYQNEAYNHKQLFLEALFGKGSPGTKSPLGKYDVIKNASISDLKKIHSRGFGAKNMRLLLAGNLPDNTEELIKKSFSQLKEGTYMKFKFNNNSRLEKNSQLHLFAPEYYNSKLPEKSSASFNLGIPAPANNFEETYLLRMVNSLLGADGYSHLFQTISRETGFVYDINSEYYNDGTSGAIYITALLPAKNQEKVRDKIFEEIATFRERLVPQENLDRIIHAIEYSLENFYDSTGGYLSMMNWDLDFNLSTDSFLEKVKSITPEAVRETAQNYLPSSRADPNYVLMIRDPFKKEE